MVAHRQAHKTITLQLLAAAIESSWARNTSASDKWSCENPALGQCAVTSLVVQDHFGGRLVRVEATGPEVRDSHYYNELPSGEVVDLTRKQFPQGTRFSEPQYREREYVLSYPLTVIRYNNLRARVDGKLAMRS